MAAENGWPTPADIYREVQATRQDVRGLCTRLDALAEDRQEDRATLGDHETRLRQLSTRQWLMALATVVLASGGGAGAGATIARMMIGG